MLLITGSNQHVLFHASSSNSITSSSHHQHVFFHASSSTSITSSSRQWNGKKYYWVRSYGVSFWLAPVRVSCGYQRQYHCINPYQGNSDQQRQRRPHQGMEDADFGELSVQRVTEADFSDIMKFLMSDFLHHEPLSSSLSMTEEEANEFFGGLVRAGIASSLSYTLRTGDRSDIAALRLVAILDRPEKEQPRKDNGTPPRNSNAVGDNNNTVATGTKTKVSPKAQLIVNVLEELENKVWILVNPRLKRLLLWSIISVGQDFTRRGLARKLLNYNLDEAKVMGCQGCVTEATALKSQQLFKKLGYEILHEVKHDEWLDERGQQIFRCGDGANSIQLAYKPL